MVLVEWKTKKTFNLHWLCYCNSVLIIVLKYIESSDDPTTRTQLENWEHNAEPAHSEMWAGSVDQGGQTPATQLTENVPWEDVCRVFRHNLQLLTQHFHGVALMLIRADNRGGPLCLLTLSPEKPPPSRSLCTTGSSSSACLFVRRHCERCGVYPG